MHGLHPKHAKPYRKRHYAAFVFATLAAFTLFGAAIATRIHIIDGGAESKQFISGTYQHPASQNQLVRSTFGFSFGYNNGRLYASAIDAATGKLYIGGELTNQRAYQTIKLSTKVVPRPATSADTISINFYPEAPATVTLLDAQSRYAASLETPGAAAVPKIADTAVVTYNGISYQKTKWDVNAAGALSTQLNSHFVSYTARLSGGVIVVKTSSRLQIGQAASDIDAVVRSLQTQLRTSLATPPAGLALADHTQQQSLLSKLLYSQASAASYDTQTVSALFAPAVVKLYNVFCTDVAIDGQPYLSNACSATSGSGFFIGRDGYIATNGHVATENPKDLVITDAYSAAASGNGQKLVSLAEIAGLDIEKLKNITDDATLIDTIFNAVYHMPDSRFTKPNNIQNLLVSLDSISPDVNKLIMLTDARQVYPADDNIKQAKVVAYSYRAADGVVKYRESDMAIVKISGSNYPVVRLGSINDVSQGSTLSILGYPTAASDNGVVAPNIAAVTLTSGKVSAIKNANGDTRKLIETDTTIGHGNSGGPVFDDAGKVVGIATYTIDGSGQGNGTFNYIRDIQDLRDLAADNNFSFATAGTTQTTWEQAIGDFNSAHYTKSLVGFKKVAALYPQHPTVSEFISRAQQNISAGKNVGSIPVWVYLAGVCFALAAAAVTMAVIIRHHGKHQLYKMSHGHILSNQQSNQ